MWDLESKRFSFKIELKVWSFNGCPVAWSPAEYGSVMPLHYSAGDYSDFALTNLNQLFLVQYIALSMKYGTGELACDRSNNVVKKGLMPGIKAILSNSGTQI